MLDDIRFSLRVLLRQRGFSLVAILTLTLGIGASAAVFSVLNGVVLKPLPYPDSDRLVNIYRHDPPVSKGPVSKPDFADIREDVQGLMTIAGHDSQAYTLGAEDGARHVLGARVTGSFFSIFGVDPLRGRWLDAADESGDTNGIVITSRLWQQQFGGRNDAIGAELMLDGEPWTVVGVAPPAMDFPASVDLWIPMRLAALDLQRGSNVIEVSGRINKGVERAQVQGRLNALAARLAADFPDNHRNLSLNLMGIHESLTAGVRDSLWMLMVAVSLVMLIVCANVANLLLSRIFAREQEFATRTALGASTSQLGRQAMVEALLLAGIGAIGGVLLAAVGVKALVALQPPDLPRLDEVALDLNVLGFAAGAALLTGVLCGTIPALRTMRTNFADTLHCGCKGAMSEGPWAHRSFIIIGEVALSMALLVAAGLLFTTMKRISNVDPGFDSRNLLTAMIALPAPQPAAVDPAAYLAQVQRNAPFLSELETQLESLPGVVEAGFIDSMPLSDNNNWNGSISAPGGVELEPGNEPIAEYRWVSPDYFRAIGVPVVAGEVYRHSGSINWPPGGSLVVNETLAELLWPGAPANAIGKQIDTGFMPGAFTVGGVVGDARQWGLDENPSPEVYFSYSGAPGPSTTTVILRTSINPLTLAEPLRRAVAEVDSQVPVFNVRTMQQATADGNARRTFTLTLLGVFAAASALVAVVGLYGVMAYAVARRTHEVGVRMALGAERRRVLRDFLRDGMTMALAGIGIGIVLAFFFAQLLQDMVWGVEITAPSIYLVAAALLALAAFGASLLPAWRASRISPMQALRYE